MILWHFTLGLRFHLHEENLIKDFLRYLYILAGWNSQPFLPSEALARIPADGLAELLASLTGYVLRATLLTVSLFLRRPPLNY